MRLREGSESESETALATLCQTYWRPIYAFLRFTGHSETDAEDRAQGFFAHLLSRDLFAAADQNRGKMRTFLLQALKSWVGGEIRKQAALKRGGQIKILSIDAVEGEAWMGEAPAAAGADVEPDRAYDRHWARALLGRGLEILREEWTAKGKPEVFDAIRPLLSGEEVSSEEIAARLGLTAGALRVTVHRMRQRYREIIRSEVADTLGPGEDAEDELRYLHEILA